MLNDQQIEGAGVSQNAPHDERVGHRLHPVGEAERAIRRKQAHLGQVAAGQPLGRCGISVDLGELDLARPAGEELDD